MSIAGSSGTLPAETATAPVSRRWSSLRDAVIARCFAQVDASSLAFFRIAFGLIMFWEVYRYISFGWIERYYVAPAYNIPYVGFEWVRPWPGIGMQVHFYALGALAMCIALGWMYRVASILFFIAFTYVFLLEKTNYLNHFYFVCLISFLLMFLPANRTWSIDALGRADDGPNLISIWTIWILKFQMAAVYVFGGLAKLNSDWLQGIPMKFWVPQADDHFPIIGQWFDELWMAYVFSYGGLLFDLSIVPLLLWSRTRWWALGASVIFHWTNDNLFQIGIFPWFSLAATVLFFPPELPRRVVHAVARWFRSSPVSTALRPTPPPGTSSGGSTTAQRVTVALLAVFVAIQVGMPLRHHLYPGDVAWTEEGHRYAWRMKLRAKSGDVQYMVTDPASGQTWNVDPDQYLTGRQASGIASHPDMIVQFAHYLGDLYRDAGYADIEVRARATVSLNGRPPQMLIDPTVDLLDHELGFGSASYILPLGSEPIPGAQSDDQPRQGESAGE